VDILDLKRSHIQNRSFGIHQDLDGFFCEDCWRRSMYRTYEIHNSRAILAVLFAGLIGFLPPDRPHRSNFETPDQVHRAFTFALALPTAPNLISASRAQQPWVSAGAKQNTNQSITSALSAPHSIQSSGYSSESWLTVRPQPHKSRHHSNRAPPHSHSRHDQ
jgi:hypothetical protein